MSLLRLSCPSASQVPIGRAVDGYVVRQIRICTFSEYSDFVQVKVVIPILCNHFGIVQPPSCTKQEFAQYENITILCTLKNS